jgi:hypothetical protein
MGEALPQDTIPTNGLILLLGEGQSCDIAGNCTAENEPFVWPDLKFDINERMIFKETLLSTNRNQLLWVLRAVTEAVADQLPEQAAEFGTHYEAAKRHENQAAYFRKYRTVKRVTARTSEQSDIDAIAQERWAILAAEHHPLVQAWEAIEQRNSERTLLNDAGNLSEKLSTLDTQELSAIAIDLLFAFDHEKPRELAEQAIARKQHTGRIKS